jgi:AAA+ ATPase superfamily predicted ATPase
MIYSLKKILLNDFVFSDDSFGRKEEMEALKSFEKGGIMILTGGYSQGKSFLVKRFFGNQSNYLYLDGSQTGPDIINAIVSSLICRGLPKLSSDDCLNVEKILNDLPSFYGFSFGSILKQLKSSAYNNNTEFLPKALQKLTERLDLYPEKSLYCLQVILKIMSKVGSPIDCIIFDAADTTFFKTEESVPLLYCLTSLSKTNRKISFIMVTSTPSPFQVHLNKFGYNTNHVSDGE